MTDQDILNRGFSSFVSTYLNKDYVIMCFQKRYDDEKGKKYFITINKWKTWEHPHTGIITPETYEYEIQLYSKDTHDPINITFHNSWEIDKVESYLENLWETGLFDYYEKWE